MGHRVEVKENENDRQILEPCQRTKKVVEYEGDGDTKCNWRTWKDPEKLEKGNEGIRN